MLVNEEQVELGTRTDMMDTDTAITEAMKEMGIAELKEKQREHRTSYKSTYINHDGSDCQVLSTGFSDRFCW